MPAASNQGSFHAHYIDCAFAVVGGTHGTSVGVPRTAVVVSNKRAVTFTRCQIPAEFTYSLQAVAAQASANGVGGLIKFQDCPFTPGNTSGGLSDDIAARFTLTNNWGRVVARDCYMVGNPDQHRAIDFEIGAANTAAGDLNASRKLAAIFPRTQTWPYNTGVAEKTVLLPKGAIITAVYLSKPINGSNSNTQSLFIGSNDKTITYGTVSGAQNTVLTINQPLSPWVDTGADASDPNQRTVRLWSTGASLNAQANIGGYAFVEYI
jgi:hypothetical protein